MCTSRYILLSTKLILALENTKRASHNVIIMKMKLVLVFVLTTWLSTFLHFYLYEKKVLVDTNTYLLTYK